MKMLDEKLMNVFDEFDALCSAPGGKSFDLTWHSLNGVKHSRIMRNGELVGIDWLGAEPRFDDKKRRAICNLAIPFDINYPETGCTLGFDVVTVPRYTGSELLTSKFLNLCSRAASLLPSTALENLGRIVGDLNGDKRSIWLVYLFCMYSQPLRYKIGDEYRLHHETTVYRPLFNSMVVIKELNEYYPTVSKERTVDNETEDVSNSEPRIPDNLFQKTNDTWTIRYQGGKVEHGIRDSKGASYLQFLLANPGKSHDVYDLPGIEKPMYLENDIPIAQSDQLDKLENDRKEALIELEEEKKAGDELAQQEIQIRLDATEDQIKSNFGIRRVPRQLAGTKSKQSNAAKKAITRFINKKIASVIPNFADHLLGPVAIAPAPNRPLRESSRGSLFLSEFRYEPASNVLWDTDHK